MIEYTQAFLIAKLKVYSIRITNFKKPTLFRVPFACGVRNWVDHMVDMACGVPWGMGRGNMVKRVKIGLASFHEFVEAYFAYQKYMGNVAKIRKVK